MICSSKHTLLTAFNASLLSKLACGIVVKDLIIKHCMDIQRNVAPIAGHAAWASNDRLETRVDSRLLFRV